MAALWEEYTKVITLSTVGSEDAQELFHNEVDDHIFASAPITIVDGFVTLICNTITDLFKIKLCIVPEIFVITDVTALQEHDSQWWYRFHVGGGPLVFRTNSKRTIPPEHKLWVYGQKEQGGGSANCLIGMSMLMVRHQ